jgi:flagellar hook-basal body complex protein FliE
MTTIDVNSVLSQIRALSAQSAGSSKPAAAEPTSGFADLLKSSLANVNAAQGQSVRLQESFELGDPNTDIASVMLATSKAQVSFRSLVEVRNRLVSAYQDIMNMPL